MSNSDFTLNPPAWFDLQEYSSLFVDIDLEYTEEEHDVYALDAQNELQQFVYSLITDRHPSLELHKASELCSDLTQDFIRYANQ